MIAGRRVRKRTLIRSDAMSSVLARTLSAVDGVVRRSPDQKKNPRQTGPVSFSNSSPDAKIYPEPLSQYDPSSSQQEIMKYLRQLSVLHDASVLTDDEFSAAMCRLFGS